MDPPLKFGRDLVAARYVGGRRQTLHREVRRTHTCTSEMIECDYEAMQELYVSLVTDVSFVVEAEAALPCAGGGQQDNRGPVCRGLHAPGELTVLFLPEPRLCLMCCTSSTVILWCEVNQGARVICISGP